MKHIPPPLVEAVGRLPEGLQAHLLRTQALASTLAQAHGLDASKASLAALAHDLCRAEPPHSLLQQARQQGLPIHPIEEAIPLLLHGAIAAERVKKMGVDDPEVLDAIRWHSTAHPSLTAIGKVVFLADKLDEGKGALSDPLLGDIGDLARRSLNAALLAYLRMQIHRLLGSHSLLHPATVETWNALLLCTKG
ncbi:MAG: bis(5'-nucleosyl)-tetraphosphatase (symmetrical) YqeK [Dehalococcoidia bacterium]